jgi:hypothetical protein
MHNAHQENHYGTKTKMLKKTSLFILTYYLFDMRHIILYFDEKFIL